MLNAQTGTKGTTPRKNTGSNPVPTDTPLPKIDTSHARVIASLKKKSDLAVPVDYSAYDSIVFDMENKLLYLFKDGKVDYDKVTLTADSMAIDFEEHLLHAAGKKDSTGQIKGQPNFKEGDQDYGAEKIAYNYKTRRGRVVYARTSLGTEYLIGQDVKLDGKTAEGKDIVYIRDGKFTSCELDHPHFYIRSRKLKIIPGDRIISGPLQLVIEDFPIPIYLPFGFFPNQEQRRSGILLPSYGEQGDRGFYLKDLGYYWAVSDKVDLKMLMDVYTKGGYRLGLGSKYNNRYFYSGNILLQYSHIKFGEKIDPDYSLRNEFFVDWQHTQKVTPNTKFNANVRAGTSGFLTSQSYNQRDIVTNQLRSSINLSHKFTNSAWNLQANLNHAQNTQSRIVTLGLPEITLSRARGFPFKKVGRKNKFWNFLDNLGYSYQMNFKNTITVPDSLLGAALFRPTSKIESISIDPETNDTTVEYQDARDFYKNGIKHSIPISTKVTVAKYLNLSPTFKFNEYWYFREYEKTYTETQVVVPVYDTGSTGSNSGGTASDLFNKNQFTSYPFGTVDKFYNNGFYATRDFNFNLSASTQFYGMYESTISKRKAIVRQTINPTLAYNYKPDFSQPMWNVYRTVQVDTSGETDTYNRFKGGIFGSPSVGEQQQINFGVTNRFELKMLKKEVNPDSIAMVDPEKKKDIYQKIVLLDNLGINGSYNFAADSLKLSQFNLNARTTLFDRKLNVQVDARLDPYQVRVDSSTSQVTHIDKFVWDSPQFSLGRVSSFTIALGTSFSSKRGGIKATEKRTRDQGVESADLMYYRAQYVDYDIPWTLNINYNLNYSNNGYRKDTTQNVRVTGDFSLTPKWKLTFSSGYNFSDKDFTLTRIGIRRDLHCWEMSMDWTPFGNYRSFLFTLAVRNPTLKDLKVTRRSDYQDRQF